MPELEETEGGTHKKFLSHLSSKLSAYSSGFRSRLYLYLWLVMFPTVYIWFTALRMSATASSQNDFEFFVRPNKALSFSTRRIGM